MLLYSIGKDSSVLLHLARKAFFPGRLPFPLLHVDTGWKFREMIAFRDRGRGAVRARAHRPYQLRRGGGAGSTRSISGAALHTRVMKTEALRQALDTHGFDAAIGGARRDEERSRAKERIFSLRGPGHTWNPRDQRPELWGLWNTHLGPGESLRVFPLSDWTEADVWDYVLAEGIAVVPLYLARPRPVVRRDGAWIVLDDDRMPLKPGETPGMAQRAASAPSAAGR